MIATTMTKNQILRIVLGELMDASIENDITEMSLSQISDLADKLKGLSDNLKDIANCNETTRN